MRPVREYTNKILELAESGFYDEEDLKDLVHQLLCWLSEKDVKEFWYANGFQDLFPEEDEE